MKSGYKVVWTDHALAELEKTVEYLEQNFSDLEIARLVRMIEATISNIAQNPMMYPESSHSGGVRKAVILRFNTLYYRATPHNKQIEIISFFANRKAPKSRE